MSELPTGVRSYGRYEGLFVPEGDRARGRTHCVSCGGRTQQRNAKRKAQHASCGGKVTKRKART